MEKHSVARLIGAPPGYVGYEEGGRLTEAVRRRPYAVVLLDEIEKAHRDVFNVLLQVLDDGRLTDGKGRTVDFKNTIVIMTSNLGSRRIRDFYEEHPDGGPEEESLRRDVMGTLRDAFRPEFLNRVDEVILFHSLNRAQIRHIVDMQLDRLRGRLAGRKLTLDVTAAAADRLAEEGFDPTFGARPLRRVIQQQIENRLAERLLSGQYTDGDRITVDVANGGLAFH
jgi:ATP-dependent Clp protease ATP-binding subunit ClpB